MGRLRAEQKLCNTVILAPITSAFEVLSTLSTHTSLRLQKLNNRLTPYYTVLACYSISQVRWMTSPGYSETKGRAPPFLQVKSQQPPHMTCAIFMSRLQLLKHTAIAIFVAAKQIYYGKFLTAHNYTSCHSVKIGKRQQPPA